MTTELLAALERHFGWRTTEQRQAANHLERIEQIAEELKELKDALSVDRTGLSAALNQVRRLVTGYLWIARGHWGSYEFEQRTEATLRTEVGRFMDALLDTVQIALRSSGDRVEEVLRGTYRQRATVPERALQRLVQHWRDVAIRWFEDNQLEAGRVAQKCALDLETLCMEPELPLDVAAREATGRWNIEPHALHVANQIMELERDGIWDDKLAGPIIEAIKQSYVAGMRFERGMVKEQTNG